MPPSTRRSLRSRASPPSGAQVQDDPNNIAQLSNDTSSTSAPNVEDEVETSLKSNKSSKKKSRSVTFHLSSGSPPSPSVSETSSKAAVSARAERSLRRQAKIGDDPVKIASSIKKISSSRNGLDMKKRIESKHSGTTIMKKGASGKDEEVVKIKMNTGILYLYKGLERKAVFVRKV